MARAAGRPTAFVIGALLVALTNVPAAAQQGSLQVSGAAQATTGQLQRGPNFVTIEPDIGVSWLQPGTRIGNLQLELHGTERRDAFHLGRVYGAMRDLKQGDYKWTVEAGDTYYSPTIGDYKFSNLVTPPVMFTGAALAVRSARSELAFVAGRGSIWRNIFGTDPDTIEQTIVAARASRHVSDGLDLNVRGSSVRNGNLAEFATAIAASDQAGGGMRFAIRPSLLLVADGSGVIYRRAGSGIRDGDGSGLVGLHWLHSGGWIQINASRFSPGDTPTINSPLSDRAGQFAAGEYDLLKRLRVFGGWEAFKSNLDPTAAYAAGLQVPRSSGARQFGGIRAQMGSRSTLSVRAESGDRISKYVAGRQDVQSDTGLISADWNTAFQRLNGFFRVAQRNNVTSASLSGSYTERDMSGQIFYRLSQSAQIFGLGNASRMIDEAGGGRTFWQAGGGAQLQVVRQGLWMRTEATVSRNTDLLTQLFIPRESISLGFNGHVMPRTSVGIDVYVDRAANPATDVSPWATRSIVRLIQTMPTGPAYVAGPGPFRSVPTRAVATVKGMVFTDWNSNGLRDAGEEPVHGVPLRIGSIAGTQTGKNGEFLFQNVPDGLHDVGLDLGALPIDFDPPAISRIQVSLSGRDTRQVTFGLIPLGAIRGRVVRDLNGNGRSDHDEPAVEGAVVVLDGGKRSEQLKRGAFAFEAVPGGEHTVTLLAESLPDGALIAGDAMQSARLERDRMTIDLAFLVSIATRAEIRKVFAGGPLATPARTAGSPPASGRDRSTANAGRPASAASSSTVPSSKVSGQFALQAAAFDDPLRARSMVEALIRKGFDAYVVEPPAGNPDAPYRVRIGRYDTRAEADRAAIEARKVTAEKLWVTSSRSGDR